MADKQTRSASDSRPKGLHTSKSFTRMDAFPTNASLRTRASTLQESGIPVVPQARNIESSPGDRSEKTDVFDNQEDEVQDIPGDQTPNPELQLPSTFDELPIEIRSLSERFLESLSAKVHPAPFTADSLSNLFQDFYERSASHVATHIATLSSRIGREKLQALPSNGRTAGKGRPRAGSGAKRSGSQDSNASGGGEMLTASEVADRKKARRLLELKRLALEEAVERGVCEKVYDKIWKHRSTDDDARDEKLRSRAAALSLVGIGLKELHMDSDPAKDDVRKAAEEKKDDIYQSLADARDALQRMDDEHYPLGKLQHLTATHKSIVETLSQIFPSSSSADEILPTLIYTLITSPPEGVNVVSNLNFIQRFRAANKVDGEAAYCLVNLEAAISFLETVDLSSLRADELPEGPPKSNSRPSTPMTETPTPMQYVSPKPLQPGLSPVSVKSAIVANSLDDAAKALPSPQTPTNQLRPPMHQRKLSSLMQQQADRIEAGREGFLNAADKVYDSINGTLENSLQFVFGRFKEQASGDSPLPKTLEDARKLVNAPAVDDEDGLSTGGRSSPTPEDPLNASAKASDNKVIELIGGRKPLRDRSVDSARSGGSGKRVGFASGEAGVAKEQLKAETSNTAGANLFASINPLNRFQVPGFARFGRSGSVNTPPAQASPTTEKPNKLDDIIESPVNADDSKRALAFESLEKQRTATVPDDLDAREALAELKKIRPPKKRFLEVQNAGDLRINEVDELLMEYRRLAKAIGEAIAP